MSRIKTLIQQNLVFVLAITGLFAFRSSLADQYSVPTGSMEPTILPGDRIFVNKIAFDLQLPFSEHSILRIGEPERGDIIVFRHPPNPSVHFVKRLVGLPGDHIKVVDGQIVINGSRASMRRLSDLQFEETLGGRTHPVQRLPKLLHSAVQEFHVPEGHYFFMGDNRDNSSDSREWGFVPRKLIEGRVIGVIASLDWSEDTLPSLRSERFFKPL